MVWAMNSGLCEEVIRLAEQYMACSFEKLYSGSISKIKSHIPTFLQQDFTQFYIDLSMANNQSQVDPSELWNEEYTATTKYGIADVTTSSLGPLAMEMRKGCERNDTDCPNTFIEYYKMNSVSYNTGECNETCQKFQLCAVTEVESDGYESCMNNWGNQGTRVQPNIWCLLLTSVASFLRHCGLNFTLIQCSF